ncbi:MAG: S-layer homology domain-containing protein [Clostridiales bacterium]|nr:S-layer homology domain-containing protein [Clostridiales bacterium]
MKKAKIIALLMSAVLSTSAAVSAASFTDMPADEATAAAINNAVNNGLLSGYEDNTVRPDSNIRRSEMAAIITRACKVTKLGDISRFTDVSKDDWFYTAMAQAYEMGAFAGDGNNMYPNNNITFQECFTVLSQVFDLLPSYTGKYPKRVYDLSSLNSYSDAADVADWAKPFYAGVIVNGGWSGVDGKLTPTSYITRAQFATVMNNLIQNYIDEPGTYTELPAGNTMIRCDGVVLDNTKISGDLYVGDSVSAGGLTVNNINAEKRFVVRGCATPTDNGSGSLTYGDTGLKVSGHVAVMRIIRPYINLDMSSATYNTVFTTENTNITIGVTAQ